MTASAEDTDTMPRSLPCSRATLANRSARSRCATTNWRVLGLRILLGSLIMGLGFGAASPASSQIHRTIEEMGPADIVKSRRQRERADELARRYLGTPLRGSELRDLTTLQRLLDGGFIAKDDVADQQALGVVFGDVMVANLKLRWIVVDDQLGRSRALRWRDTQPIFFPVTMFSKRIAAGEKVEIRPLYDRVAKDVAKLEASYP